MYFGQSNYNNFNQWLENKFAKVHLRPNFKQSFINNCRVNKSPLIVDRKYFILVCEDDKIVEENEQSEDVVDFKVQVST